MLKKHAGSTTQTPSSSLPHRSWAPRSPLVPRVEVCEDAVGAVGLQDLAARPAGHHKDLGLIAGERRRRRRSDFTVRLEATGPIGLERERWEGR